MEVPLSRELEERMTRMALARGTDSVALAREAIERFVEHDEWFQQETEKGLTSLREGRVFTHEEVGEQLRRLVAKKSIAK